MVRHGIYLQVSEQYSGFIISWASLYLRKIESLLLYFMNYEDIDEARCDINYHFWFLYYIRWAGRVTASQRLPHYRQYAGAYLATAPRFSLFLEIGITMRAAPMLYYKSLFYQPFIFQHDRCWHFDIDTRQCHSIYLNLLFSIIWIIILCYYFTT